jgi:hypothetical protein
MQDRTAENAVRPVALPRVVGGMETVETEEPQDAGRRRFT